MMLRRAADVIEGSRRAVHEAPDSPTARGVLLAAFYGAALVSGFGIVLLALAHLLSTEDTAWT